MADVKCPLCAAGEMALMGAFSNLYQCGNPECNFVISKSGLDGLEFKRKLDETTTMPAVKLPPLVLRDSMRKDEEWTDPPSSNGGVCPACNDELHRSHGQTKYGVGTYSYCEACGVVYDFEKDKNGHG